MTRTTGPKDSTLHQDSTTVGDRPGGWREAFRATRRYFVPPDLLTTPPPTVAQLANYAHRGAWAGYPNGARRSLGVWWYRLVALPVTWTCRYVEWIAQRPGRALAVFVLWRLTATTAAGPWLDANLIHPALAAIGWALL